MALAATAIGIYDQSGGTTITLSRPDVFDGATPKAAIVTAVGGADYEYNINSPNMRYGIGAVTASEALGCGIVSFDNETPNSNSRRKVSNSNPIIIPGGSSATTFGMKMSGVLGTDGITFTKVGTWASSGDLAIHVILLGGDDFDAYLPSDFVTSTSVNKGVPFLPNAAMVFGCDIPDNGNSYGSGVLSQGFVVDKGDGAAEAMSRRIDVWDNSTIKTGVEINVDQFYGSIGGSNAYNRMTHVSFTQDDLGNNPVTYEHNYTTAGVSNTPYYCPLYMKFDNDDVSLEAITLPSSTGTFTKSSYAFNPAVVSIMGNTGTTTYNSVESNANSGNTWDWFVEGSGYTTEFISRDGIDPTSTWDTAALGVLKGTKFGGGATSFIGANAQRIDSGFSVDFTSVTGSTGYTIGIAMGTPVEGGLNIALGSDSSQGLYLGSQQVTTAYLGSVSVGGVGGWRTLYSDPDPASDTSVWRGTNSTITSVTDGLEVTHIATGFAFTIFDSTVVVPGKDYRVTIVTGSGDGSTSLALQDTSGTNLTAGISCPPNSTTQITAKALDTGLQVILISSLNAGQKYLMESVLIEEMV